MPGCSISKETNWGSLATFFDARSLPDQVPWGRWRHLLNVWSPDAGKLCRRPGWRKYGFDKPSANADLHDQLLGLVGGYDELPGNPGENVIQFPPGPGLCGSTLPVSVVREPITSIHVHTDPSTARRLIVGTQSRIYSQFNDGRWRILADNMGGAAGRPHIRFRYASCLKTVVAVNDHDEPHFHLIDEAVMGCAMQAFHPIADLHEIGLTNATCVAAWKGVIFLGDVVMDGARVGHRIVWSNVNSPYDWAPRDDSISGFQDLDPGERIMAMEVIADALYAFTDRSIWRISFAGTEATFLMQQVYRQKDGDGCIWARHSLAIWNNTAVYLGNGGPGSLNHALFFYSPFSGAPQAPEWLNLSTAIMDPPASGCDLVSAAYSPDIDEYMISWPTVENALASKSMAVCLSRQVTSEVDHGFAALAAVTLRPEVEFAEFLIDSGICDAATVAGWFPEYKSEPRPSPTPHAKTATAVSKATTEEIEVAADFYSHLPDHTAQEKACADMRLNLQIAFITPTGKIAVEKGPREWRYQGEGAANDASYARIEKLAEFNCDYETWYRFNPLNGGQGVSHQWYITAGHVYFYSVDVSFEDLPPPPDPDPDNGGGGGGGGGGGFDRGGVLFSCLTKMVPEGFAVEDYTQPPVKCETKSFCEMLEEVPCGTLCPEAPLFLAASATDYALKDLRQDYFARDMWQGTQLVADVYGTRFRTGAMDFGRTDRWKRLSEIDLYFIAEATDQPRPIILRIGTSTVPSDPLRTLCPIAWFFCKQKILVCPGPDEDRLKWSCLIQQRYIYLDFEISPVTGGAVCFSRLTADLSESPETAG